MHRRHVGCREVTLLKSLGPEGDIKENFIS